MLIVLVSLLAATLPTAFYVAVIYWVDRYEKEPLWLLGAAFLWGAIPSIIAALIFNTLFTLPVYYLAGDIAGDAFGPIIAAPLVEESLKGLALVGILLLWRHEIDSILDGIIYGAMVGLGFGMVENVFYFLGTYASGGLEEWTVNIILRTLFSLNHALFSAMTGLGIALSKLARQRAVRYLAPIGGWSLAVLLHFIHNGAATAASAISGLFCFILPLNAWGGVLITVMIMIWALVQERRWIRDYLRDEVERGTLTAAQYHVATSGRRRLSHRLELLTEQGLSGFIAAGRFYHRCSELAYKKVHYDHYHDQASARLIEELRVKVRAMGGQLG